MFDSHRSGATRRKTRDRPAPLPTWLPRLGLVAGAAIAVVIGLLTLTPRPDFDEPELFGIDKLYHLVAFLVLVFPVIATGPHRWVWLVPTAIAFGGAIELIQPFVGRGAEWADFFANILGVAIGVWLGRLAHGWLHSRLPAARR